MIWGSLVPGSVPGMTHPQISNSDSTCTILTEMMADEFNFLRPEIKNYKAEADADLFPIPGQLELIT